LELQTKEPERQAAALCFTAGAEITLKIKFGILATEIKGTWRV
jgi:hypothetical protein